MNEPDLRPSIHELMALIVDELPAIGKNQRNDQQGFAFRGIADVMNELNPLLGKHGVYFIPDVIERLEEKRATGQGKVMHTVHLHVAYSFFGPHGDSVHGTTWGEGTDMGDKATPKAMTSAMKQMLFQVFAIADAEHDPDRTSPEDTETPQWKPASQAQRDGLRERIEALPESTRALVRDAWKEAGFGLLAPSEKHPEMVLLDSTHVEKAARLVADAELSGAALSELEKEIPARRTVAELRAEQDAERVANQPVTCGCGETIGSRQKTKVVDDVEYHEKCVPF